MALTKDRVLGRDVTVSATTNGAMVLTDWTEIDGTLEYTKKESNAAAATYEQQVIMRAKFTGTLKGFVSQNGTPPLPGDGITAFNVAVGSDSVLAGGYSANAIGGITVGPIKVIKVDYSLKDQEETWTASIESGILN